MSAVIVCGLITCVVSSSVQLLWRAADEQYQANHLDSAMALLQQIEDLHPGNLPARIGRATIYQRQREFDHALELLNVALTQQPHNAELMQRVGEIYTEMRAIPQALEYYQAAKRELDAQKKVDQSELLHRMALAYHHGGDFTTAEAFFRRVGRRSQTAAFHFDFGVTLERLGKILEAGEAFGRALELEPTQPQARINLAALHHQYGSVNGSISHYLVRLLTLMVCVRGSTTSLCSDIYDVQYVIELPSTPEDIRFMAMSNVGAAYETTRDIVSALAWYQRGLELIPTMTFPDEFSAQSAHLHLMVHVVRAKVGACIWAHSELEFDALWAMVSRMQLALGVPYAFPPFDSLLHAMPSGDRKAIAKQYSTKYDGNNTSRTGEPPVQHRLVLEDEQEGGSEPRLHVGYLSYDFADHPTTHLMEGVFTMTDRRSTKVVAFGYGRDDGSGFRERVVQTVEKFVELAAASFEQSAVQIHDERIHILMDCQGHTHGTRMKIVALRPAPIVVNYLVYPGTSGAKFVDYVVVDRYVAPPAELASAFTEKLVLLPHSYQVNYYEQVLNSPSRILQRSSLWERDDPKGDNEAFVFVNFNKIDKLEASVFATWMAILRRVPRSSLLLLDPGKFFHGDRDETATSREVKRNLWREADAQGISSSRIRFVPR
ncbi:hypothetical protein BBJ28_00008185 [Nothophytophthora sp. Chile5]|nr:hypothetical protein BBJ28_00008185 [Nothophytophthora sp. Chile5]